MLANLQFRMWFANERFLQRMGCVELSAPRCDLEAPLALPHTIEGQAPSGVRDARTTICSQESRGISENSENHSLHSSSREAHQPTVA